MVDDRRSRRDVLKGAGIAGALGLSGCLDTSGTESPSGRALTDLSVTGLDSAPVSIRATVTRARITGEQTARFVLTVTRQDDGRVTLVFGSHVPFSAPQYSTPSGLVLLPANADVERRTRRTWLPGEGYRLPDQEVMVKDLDSGETLTGNWDVWGDPEHVSFIEAGTYDFEARVTVESSDEPIPWTLTVTVGESSGQ